MRIKFLPGSLVFVLTLSAVPAWSQGPSATLEDRLAVLERRLDQLEKENRELKAQLEQWTSSPATLLAGSASRPMPAREGEAAHSPGSKPVTQASTESPQPKSERFEFGGQIRFRAETRQNGDLNSAQSDVQNFVAQRMRFHIRGRLSDRVESFVEFQDSRLWGQEISTTTNDNLTDLHQGYFQVKDFLRPGIYLRAGRQEFIYGTERLLGAFGWDNIGRSFDAVKMGYSSQKWWSDLFAAKLVDRRSTGRGDRDQYLYGAYSEFFRHRPRHLEVFGILFRDGLRAVGEIPSRGSRATELMTVGFRSDGKLAHAFDYDIEFAGQLGHRGFDPHRARAFAVKAGRTIEEAHKVRLGFEYDAATGDRDPKDGRSGEFFNLFPTNHPHYGYADLFGWRNMQDFRPMFSVAPMRPVKFDIDYHRFYLLEPRGPWKNAAGAVLGFDPKGQSGTHVGDELDFTLAFPLNKYLKILSGYSLFLPGEFARTTRGGDNQQFFYLQTQVDF